MSDCWVWNRSTDTNGYGHTMIHGIIFTASRLSWQLFRGPIPARMHVLHICDNRRCFNPAHLFLGTHKDNMRDMARKGRAGRAKAKLSWEQVDEIRELLRNGIALTRIADKFNVDHSQICRIKNGNTWTIDPRVLVKNLPEKTNLQRTSKRRKKTGEQNATASKVA